MYPHEIFGAAVKGHRKAVAYALHLSVSLIDQWCNDPDESAKRNPIDRLISIVKTLREESPETSELPIQFINEQLGYMPPIRLVRGEARDLEKIAAFVREVGEYLTETARANSDNTRTVEECEAMRSQIRDVLTIAQSIDIDLGVEIERAKFKTGGGSR